MQNYYSVLREVCQGRDFSVITTNYTTLCRDVAGMAQDRIAYIHGRMGWFESARELQVYDVEEEELPDDVLFPYLFVQSGMKPIVDIKQVGEYSKMIRFLEEADRLIILGYRLNADDNHVNGMLKSFLRRGKNWSTSITQVRKRSTIKLVFKTVSALKRMIG